MVEVMWVQQQEQWQQHRKAMKGNNTTYNRKKCLNTDWGQRKLAMGSLGWQDTKAVLLSS